jgi:hypothetical protein
MRVAGNGLRFNLYGFGDAIENHWRGATLSLRRRSAFSQGIIDLRCFDGELRFLKAKERSQPKQTI